MTLADRCWHEFSQNDISRGETYHQDGRVAILDSDKNGLEAEVRGSRRAPYQVLLNWSGAGQEAAISASCTCPRCRDVGLCKHLVAVILEADDRGLTRSVPGKGLLEIDPFDQFDGDDFGFDDEPEYQEYLGSNGPGRSNGLAGAMARSLLIGPNTAARRNHRPSQTSSRSTKAPNWKKSLETVRAAASYLAELDSAGGAGAQSTPLQVWYLLAVEDFASDGQLTIQFFQRQRKKNGDFGKIKPLRIVPNEIPQFADPADRELAGLLIGSRPRDDYSNYYYGLTGYASSIVPPVMFDHVLPRLTATGRFRWIGRPDDDPEQAHPLVWDDGPPFQFKLHVEPIGDKKNWRVAGRLHRGIEIIELSEPLLLAHCGLVLFADRLARLDAGGAFGWIPPLRQHGSMPIPFKDQDAFVEQLWKMPDWPPIELPPELQFERICCAPRPLVRLKKPKRRYGPRADWLPATVEFQYDGQSIDAHCDQFALVNAEKRRALVRDRAREQARLAELREHHFQTSRGYPAAGDLALNPKHLSKAVAALVAAGWQVEAEGSLFRSAGAFKLSVTSGVDWFELDAACDFEGIAIGLPELLKALEQGKGYVELGDGTRGMLPQEWLQRYAALAGMGQVKGDKLRFANSQAMFLDALLAAQPQADVDAQFERVRKRLRSFAGVQPAKAPAGFVGHLRDYQQAGLGWLEFLKEFGFGGCLADDMGLGKTIQVLALLEQRRALRAKSRGDGQPSLAVVPRSLIHNWIEEAARFTPKLRVLDYTGLGRAPLVEQFPETDLVLTTYGTLRRDIARLKDVRFDYAILDEAQAIKNSASDSAKACRLLVADHRLTMTGTPVENHLGELWSIFEFLNPGMLGRSEKFKQFSGNGRGADRESLAMLAQALRPFLLRRTKEQVLRELPEKTEQTLYCELKPPQRKLYDELREHYRASLAKRIDEVGLKRAKIHVLEALLRLRQAACHPGLLDKKKSDHASAKLDTLLEQLREVLDEGHKALVFSQFTSLLAIVRQRLDREKIVYEYLDGQTRNRKQCVDRFQQDKACPLFLVSLKAGGLGLNLTAADYVFILDPWWNPAVEAQAVDRAHRIGQTRRVFAYRLIARDTVEEKILQLQGDKRKLAEAIVSEDNSVISSLTADDLQLLLS